MNNTEKGQPMTTTEQHTEPAAWIGCLSCYNNGTLRGKWITAQQAADEMTGDEITYAGQAFGTTSPTCRKCGGDEFDVFDTEHLPHKMTAAEFYKNAETLAALDDAGDLERITALAGFLGMEKLDELITYDENNYVGQWNTFQDYAEHYADDTALLGTMPENLSYYFDWEKYAADLAHSFLYDDATGHTWHSA